MARSGNYSLRSLDVTYGLFLFVDSVAVFILSLIALHPENDLYYQMSLGTTIGVVAFLALLAGIVMALAHWRHRPLLLLVVCLILFETVIGAGALWSEDAAKMDSRVPAFAEATSLVIIVMCAAVIILVPVWWFVMGRRSYRA